MTITTWRRLEGLHPVNAYPGPSAAVAEPIWEWERLTPKDRLGALSELSDWISNVLVARYRLGAHIPACWAKHPDLVSVLVWLHETAPELKERNAMFAELESDWETKLQSTAAAWAGTCSEHAAGALKNPHPYPLTPCGDRGWKLPSRQSPSAARPSFDASARRYGPAPKGSPASSC